MFDLLHVTKVFIALVVVDCPLSSTNIESDGEPSVSMETMVTV